MSPIIVSVEGNIGSGKSTLISYLKEYYKNNTSVVFLKEPVDEWINIKDVNGTTILQKFYQNQEKYAFSFQMMAYISRLALLKKSINDNPNASVFITERCLYTDKYVFAKMLYENNKIEDVNYAIYQNWFNTFAEDYPISYLIYIHATPTICKNRVNIRNRTGEDDISLEYLSSCNEYHEQMISYFMKPLVHNILRLNGNEDIYTDKNILSDWITQINGLIPIPII